MVEPMMDFIVAVVAGIAGVGFSSIAVVGLTSGRAPTRSGWVSRGKEPTRF